MARTNLQSERTRFIGRAAELSALSELVGGERCVTICGPMGGGKSRLLRELGRRSDRDVWVCELRNVRTRDELVLALVDTLSLSFSAGDSVAAVIEATRGALVLLDDCERLDAAARALITELEHVVATSRAPLVITHERLFELAPLSSADATALFVDRGRAWDCRLSESDPAIVAIVAALDHLPLAIELAAARVDVLTTSELQSRLGRRHELSAALVWSWESLSSEERAFLCALSAFPDGVSLRAATRVVGDDARALDLLAALRRRGLLYAGDGVLGESRYFLYDAVRTFAAERGGDRETHRDVMIALAQEWIAAFDGPNEQPAILHAARERENLLAVVDRYSDAEACLLALLPVFTSRGPTDVYLARLQNVRSPRLLLARAEIQRLRGQLAAAVADAAAALGAADNDRDRGEAARQLAKLESARGNTGAGLVALRRARQLARRVNDRVLEARCLSALGAIDQRRGRLRLAIRSHTRAVTLLRVHGSPRSVAVELSFLAVATHRRGDLAAAEGFHTEALLGHRALGNRRFEAVELTHLGYLAHELAQIEHARASYQQALVIFREVGDLGLEGVALTFLARVEVELGSAEARAWLERALVLHRASGNKRLEATTLTLVGHLCRDRGDLHGAKTYYERALATSTSVEVGFEPLTHAWLAEVKRALGEDARFETAHELTARHENDAYAMAVAAIAGRPVDRSRLATSSELRRAVRLAPSPASSAKSLLVAKDGAWIVREDGTRVDFARRRAVRLVLIELTKQRIERPGEALSWQTLLAIGWPGEEPVVDSGTKRVYTAMWTLRTLGLEDLLVTRGDGYLLDPGAAVRFE